MSPPPAAPSSTSLIAVIGASGQQGVAAGGDLGFTVGEAEIRTMAPDGAPRTGYSKYLTVWRRAAVGEWRYVIDGGNDRPQP
jgi:ketosteroid isomerase-like protein